MVTVAVRVTVRVRVRVRVMVKVRVRVWPAAVPKYHLSPGQSMSRDMKSLAAGVKFWLR